MKPAILIDVDGPLNPYSGKTTPEGYTAHSMHPDSWVATKALTVRLNPLHGPSLEATGAELIWATTWAHEANEWIGPHLGLPELPVIEWDKNRPWTDRNLYWKTPEIVEWMKEHRPNTPYIWLDDECTRKDRNYMAFHTDGLGTCRQISPKTGLTHEDFTYLNDWSAQNGVHA